ncbi:MAG: hypothetical protein WAM82_28305 [Thermoanaerobaculia bacterium]
MVQVSNFSQAIRESAEYSSEVPFRTAKTTTKHGIQGKESNEKGKDREEA